MVRAELHDARRRRRRAVSRFVCARCLATAIATMVTASAGFEVGYAGQIAAAMCEARLSYPHVTTVSGQFAVSFRPRSKFATNCARLSTSPLTPRYIIPIDLRYDRRSKSACATKHLAFCARINISLMDLVYQTSRKELRSRNPPRLLGSGEPMKNSTMK